MPFQPPMNPVKKPMVYSMPDEPLAAAPMQSSPMKPVEPPMGMPMVEASPWGSRIPQSPMNHGEAAGTGMPYARDIKTMNQGGGMSDYDRLQSSSFGLDGLSNRPARQVGRSMRDSPERRLETAARHGSMRAAEGLVGQKQQGLQREFQSGMADKQFQQQLYASGMQQQAQDARHAQDRQDRMDMWNADQAAAQAARDQHFQNQVTIFGLNEGADAMKSERERQQQEMDRNRKPNIGTMPVEGTDYVLPYADGRAQGLLPKPRAQQEAPTPEQITKHIQDMQKGGVLAQYGKGGWTYAPHAAKPETVKVVNELGKVVDFPADHEIPAGWRALKKKGDKETDTPAQNTGGSESKPSSFLNF